MVSARRVFEGSVALASMSRLRDSLAATGGSVSYEIEFGKDELGIANLWIRAQADLSLLCQRSLEPFDFPVRIDTRLGLIEEESEEAGLPPGYDPLLVEKNGQLRLADVIEDELILALPVVPLKPGVEPVERTWRGDEAEEPDASNPFSVLQKMKSKK